MESCSRQPSFSSSFTFNTNIFTFYFPRLLLTSCILKGLCMYVHVRVHVSVCVCVGVGGCACACQCVCLCAKWVLCIVKSLFCCARNQIMVELSLEEYHTQVVCNVNNVQLTLQCLLLHTVHTYIRDNTGSCFRIATHLFYFTSAAVSLRDWWWLINNAKSAAGLCQKMWHLSSERLLRSKNCFPWSG